MREALLGGVPCDVMIVTEAMLAELRDQGAVAARPFVPIGEVRTGVAARARRGRAANRFRRRLEGGTARGANASTCRTRCSRPPESTSPPCWRGSASPPRPRARLSVHPNGATAMRALAESGAPGALGCTQVTEILYTPGLTLAGPLPEPFGLATVYAAGVAARRRRAGAGRGLHRAALGRRRGRRAPRRRLRAGGALAAAREDEIGPGRRGGRFAPLPIDDPALRRRRRACR